MADQQQDQSQGYDDYFASINVKLRDIEEKQNIIKERIILIGENLINEKQESDKNILELKNKIKDLESNNNKLRLAIQRIIENQGNLARKNEVKILEKQFKMFQPLELARIKDVKEIVKKELKK